MKRPITVTVSVTQEHIQLGKGHRSEDASETYPIVLAMAEVGFEEVTISTGDGDPITACCDGYYYSTLTPPSVRVWMDDFDEGKNVGPISFELTMYFDADI